MVIETLDTVYYEEYNNMKSNYIKSYKKNIIPYYNTEFNSMISSYRNLLILKTTLPFTEILDILIKRFKLELPQDEATKELYIYLCSRILNLCFNISFQDINNRYKYKEIDFNSKIRIELFKEGWIPTQIEKYMYNYILKRKLDFEVNIEYYNILISNICLLLNIPCKTKLQKIGRPSLPLFVKEIVRKKHNEKTRENMRKKYDYCDKYENIKSSLLTKEELIIIERVNLPLNIVNKLKKLTINEIS